jgi:hypothetical protein
MATERETHPYGSGSRDDIGCTQIDCGRSKNRVLKSVECALVQTDIYSGHRLLTGCGEWPVAGLQAEHTVLGKSHPNGQGPKWSRDCLTNGPVGLRRP